MPREGVLFPGPVPVKVPPREPVHQEERKTVLQDVAARGTVKSQQTLLEAETAMG